MHRQQSEICCWCAREFKLSDDMYAQDSIELLKQSGIDFGQNEARGIDVHRFGEVLMSSGIVLNDEVRSVFNMRGKLTAAAQYETGYQPQD